MTQGTSIRLAALAATLSLGLAAGVAAFPRTASADIYQYVDAEGVIHFTNGRPPDARYKLYIRGERSHAAAAGVVPVPPSDRDTARFTRYDEWIRQAATLYQIPEQLVRAVIKVESDFDPRAVSVSGARGLMQLMPDTADRLQVNPATGQVVKIDNMQVTMANTNAAEYPEHKKRVVAVWRSVVDLNGAFNGTAYLGGFHGFYAFHGLTADCGWPEN